VSFIFLFGAGQHSGLKYGGSRPRLRVGNWTRNGYLTGVVCWTGIVGSAVWNLCGHDGGGVGGYEEKDEPLLYPRIAVRVTPVGGHLNIRKLPKFEPKHAAFETQTARVGRATRGLLPFNPLAKFGAKNSLKWVARMLSEETLG